jgi:hypothetical protein
MPGMSPKADAKLELYICREGPIAVDGVVLFGPPTLPCQIQKIKDSNSAQHIVQQRILLDEDPRS